MKDNGIFVLEHGKDYNFSDHPHFVEHRQYGSVNFSLFTAAGREDVSDSPKDDAGIGDADVQAGR